MRGLADLNVAIQSLVRKLDEYLTLQDDKSERERELEAVIKRIYTKAINSCSPMQGFIERQLEDHDIRPYESLK